MLLLELDVAAALARARGRGSPPDGAFERADFLERVAAIFAAVDRPYVERIPAAGSVHEVHARVVERVRARLGLP